MLQDRDQDRDHKYQDQDQDRIKLVSSAETEVSRTTSMQNADICKIIGNMHIYLQIQGLKCGNDLLYFRCLSFSRYL